ncbi:hypothetical protein LIER_00275 [Lithospermum erythrorhizon]|uniref:Uncharacterized protein n=1 Tax=Lithospermum erythrorhizon TaxID=34254 RepID=A0AAV3NIC1_LITER
MRNIFRGTESNPGSSPVNARFPATLIVEDDLVVRYHEVKDEGYETTHDGKLIIVFSAPNYCDQMVVKLFGSFFKIVITPLQVMSIYGLFSLADGQQGCFYSFFKRNIVTFVAVPHFDVKPMAHASNFMRMFP